MRHVPGSGTLISLSLLFITYIGLAQNSKSPVAGHDHMVERKNFTSSKVARYSPLFPHAVVADNFIFVSGMPGYDAVSGKIVSDDLEAQTRQCYLNIKMVLEEAGSDLSKIVKVTQFVVSGGDMSVVNKVFKEFFPDLAKAPARSSPMVMPFPAGTGILISVECTALR
jgi:2-iminobutanoate/2-iminopropanoate deaminase